MEQIQTNLYCNVCGGKISGNFYSCQVPEDMSVIHHHNGVQNSVRVERIALPYLTYSVNDMLGIEVPKLKGNMPHQCEDKVFCTRYCHDKHCESVHALIPNSLPDVWFDPIQNMHLSRPVIVS